MRVVALKRSAAPAAIGKPAAMPLIMTSTDLDIRRRRAAYRAAHRGTKEMDWLLGRYAASHLDQMTDPELAEFEDFLAAPDPDLQLWILDPKAVPDDRYAALVRVLRAFHQVPQV